MNPYKLRLSKPMRKKYIQYCQQIKSNTPKKPKFERIDPDMPRFKPIEYDERVIDSDEGQEENEFEDESDEFQEEEDVPTEEF